ncbi:MAG: FtsX-like permease family protein [Candidatus Limivicinus sp.]|nr:FtsX-like permease family protein [Candidatus Limivicinus sp.]
MKMLLRSIKGSLGRYLAIVAIIALGVGFYAGLQSSQPAMLETADSYMHDQRMYDFQLMSTLGLTRGNVAAFKQLEGVEYAEGAYFADALAVLGSHEEPYRFMSITETVCTPYLTEGRMPENANECLGDAGAFSSDDIGRRISISDLNDEDTLGFFAEREFTIVGLAKSPRYISHDRGSTSLGSGNLSGFVLLTAEAFDQEVYQEILLYCDLPGEMYSTEYISARDKLEPEVKALLNSRGAMRYKQLRSEADKELAEARAELDEGWEEYHEGEEEAQKELSSARAKLYQGQKEIDDGLKEIEQRQKEIDEGWAQIPAAQQEIADNRAMLDEKEKELQQGKAALEPAIAEIQAGEQQLAQGKAQLEATKNAVLWPLEQAIALINGQISQTQQEIDALDPEDLGYQTRLAILNARMEQLQGRRETAVASRDSAAEKFAPQEAEIAAAEAELNEAKAQVAAAQAEIAAGEQAIAEGRAQLDAAEAEIENSKVTMTEGQKQLDEGRVQLEQAQRQVNQGWEEYEEGKAQAEQELADGKKELEDAEAELAQAIIDTDEKLKLEVFTLNRETNSGYVTFENDTSIVTAVAGAFPVFFVLIAALVCVTTMTRMINDERTQIGTLKAMGFSGRVIMRKYLWYSGSAAFAGCVLGFVLGVTVIPWIIWYAYNIIYSYTTLKLYFSVGMCVVCMAVALLSTILVTVLTCRKELSERPAELIRPKAPKAGKRILLERIKPLWKRLSFLSKVTLRNAFRHPSRVLLMMLGVGGCTALLVAGFGVKDSIAEVPDYQYGEISRYEMLVNYDPDVLDTDGKAEALWKDRADAWALSYQVNAELENETGSHSVKLVAAEGTALKNVVSLQDDSGELSYPGKGEAVVTEHLADLLEISVGDQVTLETDDGDSLRLKVTGIAKNYLSHYIYVSPETVPGAKNNAAYLCDSSEDSGEGLAAWLRSQDGISYVSLTLREKETVRQSMQSLNMIVALVVVCAAALAFIVLCNLTNINIMERVREVATVKVLGFNPGETASYILRENLLLSILGGAVGLLLGKLLHRFVMELIQVDYMCYDVRVSALSYLLAFGITVLFAMTANFAMSFKLEKINMTESLKSVE